MSYQLISTRNVHKNRSESYQLTLRDKFTTISKCHVDRVNETREPFGRETEPRPPRMTTVKTNGWAVILADFGWMNALMNEVFTQRSKPFSRNINGEKGTHLPNRSPAEEVIKNVGEFAFISVYACLCIYLFIPPLFTPALLSRNVKSKNKSIKRDILSHLNSH